MQTEQAKIRQALMAEVGRFRDWAEVYSPVRGGEWECGYESWSALYEAVLKFVEHVPLASCSDIELHAVLYAIARDNESQHLSQEIRKRHPELIVPLTQTASQTGDREARWQLALELGHLAGEEVTRMLLVLVDDKDEYVRRMALRSLLQTGSPATEDFALAAWHRPDPHQEYARMMALYCLYKLGSSHLETLLSDAELDTRQYLRAYAGKIRRGDIVD